MKLFTIFDRKAIENKFVLFAFLFFVGMVLFFPFPSFIFGEERFQFQHDVINFLNSSFGLKLSTQSDSKGMFVLVIIAFLVALIIFILALFTWNKKWEKYLTANVYYSFTSFLLSYFLLKYGFDKIFMNQFYEPEISIQYTPIYQLDRDILFWTTMGKSYSYSLITGILEILAAILLFFKSTRLLGNIFALVAFVNIVAINIGFDITVKFLAFSLCLLSLINVLLNGKSLYRFLVLHQVSSLPTQGLYKKNAFQRALKFLTFSLIIIDCSAMYIQQGQWKSRPTRSLYKGAYEVIEYSDRGETFFGEMADVKRIFFQQRPFLIIQNKVDQFHDFGMHHTSKGTILLEKEHKHQEVYFNKMSNKIFKLKWSEIKGGNEQDYFITLRKVSN